MTEETIDRADQDLDQDAPPALDVVLQVEVVGPVRTQDIAVAVPATRHVVLAGDETTQLIGGDPRRRMAKIISTVNDIYVSPSRADILSGTAAVWPATLPLEWHGREAVYVRNANPATETIVSVISEALQ